MVMISPGHSRTIGANPRMRVRARAVTPDRRPPPRGTHSIRDDGAHDMV